MANCCPACGFDTTQFLADRWHCLSCDTEWSTNTVPRTIYTKPGPRGAAEITPQSEAEPEPEPEPEKKATAKSKKK